MSKIEPFPQRRDGALRASSMTEGLLQGKKVLITGSSRGIGRSCALAMARQGADVAIHYRRERELADQTAEEVRALGREALVFEADLEDAEQIDRMFDGIQSSWGALDVFMANAASTAFKPLAELRSYHFERTFHVVVQSVLQSVQRCLPLMEGRQGRVITVSSPGSHVTLPRYASIGTAKAALEALTRYIAAEFGPKGITANAISPGVVQTDSATYYAKDKYEEWRQSVIEHTPLQRLVMPDDVADVAVFLASDWSRFVTGQILIVDGGLELTGGGFEMV